jgi:hypothetical protein
LKKQAYAVLPFGIPDSSSSTDNSSTSEIITNTTAGSSFLTYSNDVLGLKIQYPEDWNIKEIGSSSVRFAPAYANSNAFLSPNVAILVQPAEQYLDMNDMKVKSKPPLTYVLGTLMFFGDHIVRSTSVNIPGADSFESGIYKFGTDFSWRTLYYRSSCNQRW